MAKDGKAKQAFAPFGHHWRAPLAGVIGALAGVGLGVSGLKTGAAMLLGWDVAALIFLATTGWVLLFDDECDLRERAGQEDEGRPLLTTMVVGCIAFAFAAIIIALREGHSGGPAKDAQGGVPFLSIIAIITLMLSWLCVQALFTLHYAHRYFGDPDKDGEVTGGINITGDPPSTYRDFIYMAVCIGACFQVSDFGPTNTRLRNLMTAHALISFAFNALVISLGVGIVGDLLKG